jgi:hypothetical protein
MEGRMADSERCQNDCKVKREEAVQKPGRFDDEIAENGYGDGNGEVRGEVERKKSSIQFTIPRKIRIPYFCFFQIVSL